MIKLDTKGIDAFNRALGLEWARFDREISQAFFKWTVRIFTDLVRQTPQWSGDLTANWNYSVHQPDYAYAELHNKREGAKHWSAQNVYQRGMDPAVNIALTRMKSVAQPTWRDKVFFANATPIAPYVEAQTIKIRPINLVEGQVAMISYTVMKESQRGFAV